MIDSKSFDDLVPVFLMDSGVFHVVILDVEGSILKGNVCFAELNPSIVSTVFCDFLTPGSKVVFSKLLDALLEVPSSAKDHMLTHSREHGGTFEVSWGFSLVSDSNVSGIVGIGVAAELLEKEMDWCNPLDLLEFGEIKLDRESKVVGWDRRILKWFDVEEEKWKSRPLADLPAFEACVGLNETLQQVGKSGKPKIFHLAPKVAQKRVFIAVLSADPGGYSLILKPKDIPIQSQAQTNGSLVSDEVLAALPGAILVLDETGNLCQQNEAARNLGRVWNGRAYSEGFPLTFSIHSSRFAELLQAMEACKKGIANDLELTLPKSDHAFDHWNVSIRPIFQGTGSVMGILIQVLDTSALNLRLFQVNREKERLRDLISSPTHILRGPLSSIIGLLELIDVNQLDEENKNLFGYLEPLANELDRVIREHAKKLRAFD